MTQTEASPTHTIVGPTRSASAIRAALRGKSTIIGRNANAGGPIRLRWQARQTGIDSQS